MIPNIFPQTSKNLSRFNVDLLRSLGDVAQRESISLYLVGGSVRDLLLKRPIRDLDLVTEGDLKQNALLFAQSIGAQISQVSQFGTVKLLIGETVIDVASARIERYPFPGSLPEVWPGSIQNDLSRRDFTINAIAVNLIPGSYGEILDPFNGIKDLNSSIVRILHSRSFIDDPTRILRAIRYESRLGFCMDKQTKAQAINSAQYLDRVSGDRVRSEFERTFDEKDFESMIDRMVVLGTLIAILPCLKWSPSMHHAFTLLHQSNKICGPLHIVGLLSSELTKEEGDSFTDRLNMPSSWRRIVSEMINLRDCIYSLDTQDIPNSRIYQILNNLEVPTVECWSVLVESMGIQARLIEFLHRLRYIKPALKGNDLINLGVPRGPDIGRILNDILSARLDGIVSSLAEEQCWVKDELNRN